MISGCAWIDEVSKEWICELRFAFQSAALVHPLRTRQAVAASPREA